LVGAALWEEQVLMPSAVDFDVNISNLLPAQIYEYQYFLEDNNGNKSIMEWERI